MQNFTFQLQVVAEIWPFKIQRYRIASGIFDFLAFWDTFIFSSKPNTVVSFNSYIHKFALFQNVTPNITILNHN
jgi:hypothetical protein